MSRQIGVDDTFLKLRALSVFLRSNSSVVDFLISSILHRGSITCDYLLAIKIHAAGPSSGYLDVTKGLLIAAFCTGRVSQIEQKIKIIREPIVVKKYDRGRSSPSTQCCQLMGTRIRMHIRTRAHVDVKRGVGGGRGC